MRLLRMAALALAIWALAAAQAQADPAVKYLAAEIIDLDKDLLVVRGQFEILNGGGRWFAVCFQIDAAEGATLKLGEDAYFVDSWADLLVPLDAPVARFTDCRAGMDLKRLAKAAGVPREAETTLWVSCHVWDVAARKYLGTGWPQRAGFAVTLDKDGQVANVARGQALSQPQPVQPAPPPAQAGGGPLLDVSGFRLETGADGRIRTNSAFGLRGDTQRWHNVAYGLFTVQGEPVADAAGKPVRFGSVLLFPPENVRPAAYPPLQSEIRLKDLPPCPGLPRGQSTVLKVAPVAQPHGATEEAARLDVGLPLVVTVDAAGALTRAAAFSVEPIQTVAVSAEEKMNARVLEPKFKVLRLKPGAQLFRALGLKHDLREYALVEGRLAELRGPSRAFAFDLSGPEGAERAAELVMLAHPGAVIIQTREQYAALLKALRDKGWPPGLEAPLEEPPGLGLAVEAEPSLGWRVRVLWAACDRYYGRFLGPVYFHEFCVSEKGEVGFGQSVVCIPAPSMDKDYTALAGEVLAKAGAQTVPDFALVTDKKASFPCPEGASASYYLNDYAEWPEYANP